LKAQSEKRWLVRHFLKHYHYPKEQSSAMAAINATLDVSQPEDDDSDDIAAATKDAFNNWKVLYNTSLVMTYGESNVARGWLYNAILTAYFLVSFACLAWKIYSIPSDWTVSGQALRHVLGAVSGPAPVVASMLI
jgi:phosphatidylethanolamine N-methyltransferase